MSSAQGMDVQRSFWNGWNASTRELQISEVSRRQRQEVVDWLRAIGRRDLEILEVGCGAGWLVPDLLQFGAVTATDLADDVVARAAQRCPEARFFAGDFMALDLPSGAYDVIVSLEVLSHVADQRAFARRIARLLRPGGVLMMATQNRPILEINDIPPPAPGQLRRWVDMGELRALLAPHFEIEEMRTVTPLARRGILRFANSYKLKGLLRPVIGESFERWKERRGYGWTIMARARRGG